MCLDFDSAIVGADGYAGGGHIEDRGWCEYIVDPAGSDITCTNPAFMEEVCERLNGKGEALTYCNPRVVANCSDIYTQTPCKESPGCYWTAQEPAFCLQFDEANCYSEASYYGCSWQSFGGFGEWCAPVPGQCINLCNALDENLCKSDWGKRLCYWKESGEPAFCLQFDEANCSEASHYACTWTDFGGFGQWCAPAPGACLDKDLLEVKCVGDSPQSNYMLSMDLCNLPYNVILGTEFTAAVYEDGVCECAFIDTDGDTHPDFATGDQEADNCIYAYNPKQEDYEKDVLNDPLAPGYGIGDACECVANEPLPLCKVPFYCDSMQTYDWPDCLGCVADEDQDFVCDFYLDENGEPAQFDNCLGKHNTDQADIDGDGKGNACDCDSGDLTPEGLPACTAEEDCYFEFEEIDEDCCNDFDVNPETGELEPDGYCRAQDCAPNRPDINPGMPDGDVCDGIDNNCSCELDANGKYIDPESCVDEGYVPYTCGEGPYCERNSKCVYLGHGDAEEICKPRIGLVYADPDGDQFGDQALELESCYPVEGYVLRRDDPSGKGMWDCDSDEARIYPLAPPSCDANGNNIDNSCDWGFTPINCDELCVDKDGDGFAAAGFLGLSKHDRHR
jgi:hypothetical protein